MTDPTTGSTPNTARFERERTRHRFTAREAVVTAVSQPAEGFIRVTLSGPELHDFVSSGPADHTRLFFPHPITGELIAPTPVGPDADGIERPELPMFPRDFTPLNVRTDETTGHRAFDVDFLQHEDPGPASAWSATAKIGDKLVAVGPRGSAAAPQNAPRLLLVVDGSALPSALRWITEVPATTEVEVVLDASPAEVDWMERYLVEQSGREVTVTPAYGSLADEVVEVDDQTFLYGAGEASRLISLRKLLKYDFGLPREQYALSGYWKRDVVFFDHHAPIDPEDPDE